MSEELGILINCDEGVAKELKTALSTQGLGAPMLSQRKGIGGDVASWVLVVQALVSVVPSILLLVSSRLGPNRVTKIKVGDVEIENPTKEQVDLLLAEVSKRTQTGLKS